MKKLEKNKKTDCQESLVGKYSWLEERKKEIKIEDREGKKDNIYVDNILSKIVRIRKKQWKIIGVYINADMERKLEELRD